MNRNTLPYVALAISMFVFGYTVGTSVFGGAL